MLVAVVEQPLRTDDILVDYPGNRALDATELFSVCSISGLRHVLEAPRSETFWQLILLLIPYELPHEHEDVVGVQITVFGLRDGFEIWIVSKYHVAICCYLSIDGATVESVAGESFIHNSLDVFIVFLLMIPSRVQIIGM